MNAQISIRIPLTGWLIVLLGCASPARSELVDDRNITLDSPASVASKRQALAEYIWGAGGLPTKRMPDRVRINIPSPVDQLENLSRVDELVIETRSAQGKSVRGLAHHFLPATHANGRLVILHHGHGCTFNDPGPEDHGFGLQHTVNHLLFEGYSVLAVYMPGMMPDDCGKLPHDGLFSDATFRPAEGSPLQYFLNPTAVSLNYLKTRSATDGFPVYSEFDMAGLSGGGWTTTVYAAVDPTITISSPVAGTMPLYLRAGGSVGDMEQFVESFYRLVGYPDLYILGAYGPGRKQVQILNRHDDCCFGETRSLYRAPVANERWEDGLRRYEAEVRTALDRLGSGGFRVEIDETAKSHQISHQTIFHVILSELNGGRRAVGAAQASDAFIRGVNGHLWRRGPAGWADTGLSAAGPPAVLQGAAHAFDLFYRDPLNRLAHGFLSGTNWQSEVIGDRVSSDPVAVSGAEGRLDVAALDSEYLPCHWRWADTRFEQERATPLLKGLGGLALTAEGTEKLHLFLKGWDRRLYHLEAAGKAPWSIELVGKEAILDSPSAITSPEGVRVYARARANNLLEARRPQGGAWVWSDLSELTGSRATSLAGSPSAAIRGGAPTVVSRTADGQLATFVDVNGRWGFKLGHEPITGSPTGVSDGVLARGPDGELRLDQGQGWVRQGGRVE